jgi:hypothetical protein
LRISAKIVFGLGGQDEHPTDTGDQAHEDEGLRIQGTPMFDRNGDRVKQLGYDEQQKDLVEQRKDLVEDVGLDVGLGSRRDPRQGMRAGPPR